MTEASAVVAAGLRPQLSPRTRSLLETPLVPIVLRLAWPNVLIMLAQASTGLTEAWFVAKLGADALAGMALVLPVVMLMQTLSGGAMGGAIASGIARSLGAGQRDRANAMVLHAVVLNILIGIVFSVLILAGGGAPVRRAGRRGRLVARGTRLFQRGVCRGDPAVGDERPHQRDPRHWKHADPWVGDVRRCRVAGAALSPA